MPIVKIYSPTNPKVDKQSISQLTQEYFAVSSDKIKIIFIQTFAQQPSGLFVEINAKTHSARTDSRMQEYLKKLETYLSDCGYPGAGMRVEFFPAAAVHGVN